MAESLPSISAAQSTARTGEKSTHCRLAPLSFICYGKGPGIACSFVFGDCLATRTGSLLRTEKELYCVS